jgi:RNA polymerase sigma factor (sigma-70 family)
MTDARLGPVVRHIHRLAAGPGRPAAGDRALLHDFATRNDQAAFAAIVHRHGPLVLGVCRRVLHNPHDAEDAFQATFLALAQGAASIRKQASLSSWLHGVAYRTALRAKRDAARRRAREGKTPAAAPPSLTAELSWREVQAALDEEVQRLPEIYRGPFLLCALGDLSRAEAARQLGLKEGTVSSRLAHARKQLQERLARRGVTLAALLAAVALGQRAGASPVPPPLVKTTVKAARGYAAGAAAAGVPAEVAALVQGVTPTMSLTKLKLAALLLLAAGLLALGAGLPGQPPAAASPGAPPPPAAADKAKGSSPPALADAPAGAYTGRVLGPDGKPFAGARVVLWAFYPADKGAPRPQAASGADGRFRLSADTKDTARGGCLVATAAGLVPDWVPLPSADKAGETVLRLTKDDLPINVRILDLEGQPVAGAAVQLTRVARGEGDLAPWIDAVKRNKDYPLTGLPPEAVGLPASLKTGRDGRIRLAGVGREHVVSLAVTSAHVANTSLKVLTRPEVPPGLHTGWTLLCPATFDVIVQPSKPIVGTVRDRRTGKPVAGITVACPTRGYVRATTDEQGRYRLDGVAKKSDYWVAAGGLHYFNSTRMDVADTPGQDPITVDFDLDRGLLVRGRLVEKGSGKPVNGHVGCNAAPDNPNLKGLADLGKPQVGVYPHGETAADGSFTALTVPGANTLCAFAWDYGRYLRADPGKANLGGLILEQFHAIIPVTITEEDARSRVYEVALEPARERDGTVVGPDGKPLSGACPAGLSPIFRFETAAPEKMDTPSFRVGGLAPGQSRSVLFIHEAKGLAKVQKVDGDGKGPLTVRLEPLGGLTGRVLGADGRPWPGLKVAAPISADLKNDYADLPRDLVFEYPRWSKLTNREATTDKDGRFRLDGLVPGLKYQLNVTEGEGGSAVTVHTGAIPTPESGKTRDLGDLKSKLTPGKGEGQP